MLIIVEGPDGSGKTTLVDSLSHAMLKPVTDYAGNPIKDPEAVLLPKNADFEVRHCGPLKIHPMEEYELPLIKYDPKGSSLICDRWHVGELIYGPLWRGASQLTPAMKLHVDMVLERLGAVKLVMDTPFEEVVRRCKVRGEKLLQEQHMRLVWDAFNEQCTYVDGWTRFGVKSQPGPIIDLAEQRAYDAQQLTRFRTYVGSVKPDVLILGDTNGQYRANRPRYPWAFVPYRDTAGHYLFSALDSVGMRNFGISHTSNEDLLDLWITLGEPKIVCLGRDAETMARNEGFDKSISRVVQHPDLVQRFTSTSMHAYGTIIKEAVNG